jgi:hypothetical protein
MPRFFYLTGKVIFGELDSLLGRRGVVLVLQHHHNIAAGRAETSGTVDIGNELYQTRFFHNPLNSKQDTGCLPEHR